MRHWVFVLAVGLAGIVFGQDNNAQSDQPLPAPRPAGSTSVGNASMAPPPQSADSEHENQNNPFVIHQEELGSCYRIPAFDPTRDVETNDTLNEVTIEFGYLEVHRIQNLVLDGEGRAVYDRTVEKEEKKHVSFGAFWSVSHLPSVGAKRQDELNQRIETARSQTIAAYHEWLSFNREYLCDKPAPASGPTHP